MRLASGGVQLAVRAAIAAGLAILVAQSMKFEKPIYAILAAVIVTDFEASQTRALLS